MEGIATPSPAPNRFAGLAGAGAAVVGCLGYAALLFLTLPTKQGPDYDGPHRLPDLAGPALPLLALVLALPVLPAWRRPFTAYVLVLAETAAAAEYGARNWALFAAAVAMVCRLARIRTAAVSGAAALAVVAAWVLEQRLILPADMAQDLATSTGQIALCAACGWGLGYGSRKRREYAASLREQSAARAVMAERLRIARELHDMVAHSVGIVTVLAGAAGRVLETRPEQAREALDGIETTSRETLLGLQRMLGALRRAEPDAGSATAPLGPAEGLGDLARLAERAADAGVRVELCWRGDRRPLPPEIELSAYRLVQEAVTNVVRHADTRRCRVRIGFEPRELSLEIVDDGRGPAAHPHPRAAGEGGGFGLLGMRERVALLGGEFSAGPNDGGGFRVAARLPG